MLKNILREVIVGCALPSFLCRDRHFLCVWFLLSAALEMMNADETKNVESDYIKMHHMHGELLESQCSSTLVKHIKAPLHLVSLFCFLLDFSLSLSLSGYDQIQKFPSISNTN